MAIRPRLIAWAEPKHESIIRALLADNACELIGVCAAKAGDAAALAQALETERLSDLRQAMLSPDAEVIWLANPATIDSALRRAIREHGLLVLTSEPNAELLVEHTGEPHEASVVTFVPAFVDGRGFGAAMDTLEQFGRCTALNLVFTCRPEHGSLFARLFDAMLTVRTLLGPVELVDASMTMQRGNVPEQLTGLAGTMTLNMRIEGHRTASVLVSNEAPAWKRETLLIGADGKQLRIGEEHAVWIGEDESALAAEVSEPGLLIADRLVRLMQNPGEARSHGDGTQLLAMCEAARLSARVGFAEAPGKISQMLSRP